MKVKDIMTTRNLATARKTDSVFLVGQLMQWRGVRHVPVLDETGVVAGVVSARDLAVLTTAPGERERVPVAEVMRTPVEVTVPDDDVATAAAVMASRKVGCLPVVEKGKLVGLLTATDLVGLAISGPLRESANRGAPVATVMRREPATTTPHHDLLDAVALMIERGVRHLPVVDGARRLVGMLSDRDVRSAVGDPVRAVEAWAAGENGPPRQVAEAMTAAPVTAHPEETVDEVTRRLADERVGAVAVVDHERRLLGIVSYVDLLLALRR